FSPSACDCLHSRLFFLFFLVRSSLLSTLFPYTTLFRSVGSPLGQCPCDVSVVDRWPVAANRLVSVRVYGGWRCSSVPPILLVVLLGELAYFHCVQYLPSAGKE